MKLIVLLLLLLNLLAFSWIQWGQPAPEPAPVELNADKVSIVGRSSDNPNKNSVNKAPTAPEIDVNAKPATALPDTTATPTAIPSSATSSTAPAISASTIVRGSCMEWGPVAINRVPDAEIRLNRLKLGDRLGAVDTTVPGGPYWVYFPPLASKEEADSKASEWQGKGIKDVTVIRDGKWLNALSLGLYSKEAIAQVRVENLKKIGINAHIDARGKAAKQFTFYNLNIDEIDQLKKMQATFGGPPLKKTTCKPA